jgi:hypothetical protein
LASDIEKLMEGSRRFCGNRRNPVQTQNGEGERPRETLTSAGSPRIPKDGDLPPKAFEVALPLERNPYSFRMVTVRRTCPHAID